MHYARMGVGMGREWNCRLLASQWLYFLPFPTEVACTTGAREKSVCSALPADWLPALCPHSYLRVLLHGELEQAGSHLLCYSDSYHRRFWRLCAR